DVKLGHIKASLNDVYEKKIVISKIYHDWSSTISAFETDARKKKVSDKHIEMFTDTLDCNHQIIMDAFGGKEGDDKTVVALEMAQENIVGLFLDEVKAPYATVVVDKHAENMFIRGPRFEEWLGALYYHRSKELGKTSILSKEMITRIQSVFSFEADN